ERAAIWSAKDPHIPRLRGEQRRKADLASELPVPQKAAGAAVAMRATGELPALAGKAQQPGCLSAGADLGDGRPADLAQRVILLAAADRLRLGLRKIGTKASDQARYCSGLGRPGKLHVRVFGLVLIAERLRLRGSEQERRGDDS